MLAGLLSTVAVVSPTAASAADDPGSVVPGQSTGTVQAQEAEPSGKPLPAPVWPKSARATVDLRQAEPGEPGEVTASPSAPGDGGGTQVGVVEIAPVPAEATDDGTSAQLSAARALSEDDSDPTASASASASPRATASPDGVPTGPSGSATPDPEDTGTGSPGDGISPDQVDVQILDRDTIAPVGGIGMGLRVVRDDGVAVPGIVEVTIDYSGFKYAYGGDFADRLRLVRLPACALTTPQAEQCASREVVEADNDVKDGALTATVIADADADPASDAEQDPTGQPSLSASPGQGGTSAQLGGLAPMTAEASGFVYAVVTGASSDQGDYRASPLGPSGSWEVGTGSGAFTYALPINVPAPPMGKAPSLALTYNSQSVDGRTSATNNQASWVGMGWDLSTGYIERRYRNCTNDGLPTIGDMCWDSPNSAVEPGGAVYILNLNGVSSQLIQDNNGTGSYHLQDDPGWRIQHMAGGYGADDEYWVINTQDGSRYYMGWGRSERTGTATASVFTVPVVGNDAGEPCHSQFPEPCSQAWRWNLDRAVDPNEVETIYFYDKEYNHYRSVANVDKPREYVSGGYVKEIQYGWSSQIGNGQLPAKIDLTHVNRCTERMALNDPLRGTAPTCPTFNESPGSYPDVPVDLMCDGTAADYACAGKTYYPSFFSTDMLWDIKTYVRDNDSADWELVMQYQTKHGLPNPAGAVGKTLWLDYVQRKTYGSGENLVLPVINFNGVDLDNQVGSSEINFRRVSEIHGDLGATTAVTYGQPDPCDGADLPSQSTNTEDCYWQKWVPDGSTEAKTGWFKKFLVTKVTVDPTVSSDQNGEPEMVTSYAYSGGAGWRFSADPLTKDEDESWTDWRGYRQVEVTTGAGLAKRSTVSWLYRGLSGDRITKTDPAGTRTVTVFDGEGNSYTDHAWLAGKLIETSSRDDQGASHQRVFHEYWTHNTAQYDGLPDARFVREDKTTIRTPNSASSTWHEHVVENEYDDTENASTVFGLPMKTDDWGETGISDNRCTAYGRAYNTDDYDSTGIKRFTVLQDQLKHYSVGCSSIADSNQDGYTSTLYDGSASVDANKPFDGNPTEVRTYTSASLKRAVRNGYDAAGRALWTEDGNQNRTTTAFEPTNSWPISGVTVTTPDPDGSSANSRGPLTTTTWYSPLWGTATTVKDVNGNLTKVDLDAAGRTIQVWLPTEVGGSSPSRTYTYSIPTTGASSGVPDVVNGDPEVTAGVLQSGSTYLYSHAFTDALGRARETQNKLPQLSGASYRQVTVTRYDAAGNVTGTSAPFKSAGPAGDGVVNPAASDIPSYNDLVQDWAGRPTLSRILVKNVEQTQGKTRTDYHDDYTTVTPPTGGAIDTHIDIYGQTSKVVEHSGVSTYATSYSYTGKGVLRTITDPQLNVTTYGYDWAAQRTSVDDPDAGKSTTTYDDNGQVSTTTAKDPVNGDTVLQYAYDNLGRKTSIRSGSDELAAWVYDNYDGGAAPPTNGMGRVISSTSRDTQGRSYTTSTIGFDERGRPLGTSVTIPTQVTGLAGTYKTTYTYDAADHITSVGYPAVGDPAKGGLPKETVTTGYDAYGRPNQLTSKLGDSTATTTYVSATTYDETTGSGTGALTGRTYGATTGVNAQRTYAYDIGTATGIHGTGALTGVTTTTNVGGTTKTVQKDTYLRNDSGEITALKEDKGTFDQQQCFTYDNFHRLLQAWTASSLVTCSTTGTPNPDFNQDGAYQTKFTYDRLGNLQSATDTNSAGVASTRDYLYPGYNDAGAWTGPANPGHLHGVRNIQHQDASGNVSSTDAYTYDAAGRMTKRVEPTAGTSTDYTWNKTGQLATATVTKNAGGQEKTTYAYDATGTLILRTDPARTVAYVEGQDLTATNSAQTGTTVACTRYYSIGGSTVAMRTSAGVTYLMADQQASAQLTVDATTGAISRRRYTPFGDQRSTQGLPAGTDHGFLGKTEDTTTGLSLLGARAYDPLLGRFLSPDPLSSPYDPQNLSAYSYSRNNPVNFSDPTGLKEDDGSGGRGATFYNSATWGTCPVNSSCGTGGGTGGGTGTNAGSGDTTGTNGNNNGGHWWNQIDWREVGAQAAGVVVGGLAGSACEGLLVAGAPLTGGTSLAGTAGCAALGGVTYSAVSNAIDEDEESATDVLKDTAVSAATAGVGGAAELIVEKAALRYFAKTKCFKNSFIAETEVQLADGTTKPIEDVTTNDKVLATDPETGKTESREVLATIITEDDKNFTDITVKSKGKLASLISTDHHPFWTPNERKWTDASDLEPSQWLRTSNGTKVQIVAVAHYTKHQRTYNLTVDGLHTYYVLAGKTPVLVHNSNCKIDTIANDWAQKGFHVKLPGQGSAGEVSVSADADGNLLFRSTFSGKAGKTAIAKVEKDFQDPAFRGKALEQATKGLEYLEQNHSYSQQIPGLRNLVKALGQ
ncbi:MULTISPECIES: RHS repeat-associated core domain-containing protein [unclassified Streptomyces]|uniref:RHS repeat-associated core domain-containing protein n=1 Tax=unclassified Streptomyces TaxID=2593676 RepID=UPI002351A8CC|nr:MULTISPECIES: RHS repeat-associated core domain-containing protein [unclassified Streptomyces]